MRFIDVYETNRFVKTFINKSPSVLFVVFALCMVATVGLVWLI
jgi:hypothetical protein